MNKKESIKFSIAFMFLVGIMIFYSLNFISASTGSIIQNQGFNITQNCPNSTYANLSKIQLMPSTNILLQGNLLMTKSGDNYLINVNKGNSSTIGTLWIYGNCDQNGIYTPWQYSLDVTPTGYSISTGQSFIMLGSFFLVFIIAILLLVFGLKSAYAPVKMFCYVLSVVLIVFSIGYGLNIISQITGEFSAINGNLNTIYIIMIGLMSAGGIGLILYLIYVGMEMFNSHRGFSD